MDNYAKAVTTLLRSAQSAGYTITSVQTPHYLATIRPGDALGVTIGHITGSNKAVIDFLTLTGDYVQVECDRALAASESLEFIDHVKGVGYA